VECVCDDQICPGCAYLLKLARQVRGLSKHRDPDDLDSSMVRYERNRITISGNRVERYETQKELETRKFIADRNRYYHIAATLLHDLHYAPREERRRK
jgi:hypothetical protein